MASNLKSVYTCADGREFAVEWRTPEDAALTWFWDPEHNPVPCTPLDVAAWSGSGGHSRARAEAGFAPTDIFLGNGLFVHGFNYWRPRPSTDEEQRLRDAANDAFRRAYGTGASVWKQWCLPRTIEAVDRLRDAGVETPVADLIEVFGYGYEQTFLMWGIDRDALRDFLKEELGDEADRVAVELTKGYPNATLEADQALWELAQTAATSPALKALLLREAPPAGAEIAAVEGGQEFRSAFARYLDRYGWRTLDWDVSTPMVRERPELALGMVRRSIAEGLPEPAARVAVAAEAREALVQELEERLAADPAKLEEFRTRMQRHAEYLGVKEGRALWQLTLNGALRFAFLKKGQLLAESGALDSQDDVFYLLPDEIDIAISRAAELPGSQAEPAGPELRLLAAGRRAERERWLGVAPPSSIGGEAPAADEPLPLAKELRGTGASKGVVTAVARVLSSAGDYARLAPGEVLVCSTTTPAWTPLFAVAGAVVTEGGGVLSHTAIAAREYGIPAVVGLRGALRLIPDGATVTVDGAGGTVSVDAESK